MIYNWEIIDGWCGNLMYNWELYTQMGRDLMYNPDYTSTIFIFHLYIYIIYPI